MPLSIAWGSEGESREKQEAERILLESLLSAERNHLAGAPTYTTDEIREELQELLQ